MLASTFLIPPNNTPHTAFPYISPLMRWCDAGDRQEPCQRCPLGERIEFLSVSRATTFCPSPKITPARDESVECRVLTRYSSTQVAGRMQQCGRRRYA